MKLSKDYPSDLSDTEWAIIESLLPRPQDGDVVVSMSDASF